ncbi:MAG: hypothetical protein WEE64_11760 [Dehalococcoidia bacterium]
MAEAALIEALANCLDAQHQGEASLRACLERYPEFRVELEELLAIVRLIPRLPDQTAPSPAFRERTRRRLLGRPNGRPSPADLGWRTDSPS